MTNPKWQLARHFTGQLTWFQLGTLETAEHEISLTGNSIENKRCMLTQIIGPSGKRVRGVIDHHEMLGEFAKQVKTIRSSDIPNPVGVENDDLIRGLKIR